MIRLLAAASTTICLVAIFAALLTSTGCTITHGDSTASLGALLPSDEVQTTTQTIWGVNIDPQTMRAQVGYIRNQATRVPAHDANAKLGDVVSVHSLVSEGVVTATDRLEVGFRVEED
jgi:hypothetical protein